MTLNNKNSYFCISVIGNTKPGENESQIISNFEDIVEPTLSKMLADEVHIAKKNKEEGPYSWEILLMFRTKNRKRLSVLRNSIRKTNLFLDDEIELTSTDLLFDYQNQKRYGPIAQTQQALTKVEYKNLINALKKQKDIKFFKDKEAETYKGKDIEMLNEKRNWYEWQLKLYDMIFDKLDRIKDSVEREIIFIEDPKGNGGKSTFWKWLYIHNQEEIGILSEASTSQLKGTIVNLGEKKLYIVDLPRNNSQQGTTDLLNALESLKNGLINTSMYGSAEILYMAPPWIVITGNSMPSGSWTPDRWKVFEITNNKDWKDVSLARRSRVKQEIILDNKIKNLSSVKKEIQLNKLLKSQKALSK